MDKTERDYIKREKQLDKLKWHFVNKYKAIYSGETSASELDEEYLDSFLEIIKKEVLE